VSSIVNRPATIDAASWAQVVDAAALTGMVRQLALNCVPASFEKDVLVLKLDQAAAHGRSRQIEDKLVQFISQYVGREIRIVFESTESALNTPARRRTMVEQDKTLRAVTAFEQDATVKALRERFGADVDIASVKPI
jgi:DNA polymerase-3 subunit gamma/tau